MPVAASESNINYDETASLAMEAFASPHVVFEPAHLRWLYNDAFSLGANVIALQHEGRKVGQMSVVRQKLKIDGVDYLAGQLCDLFILKEHRSKQSLATLFDEIERQFKRDGMRFAIAMPNKKAVGINEYFFQMTTHMVLPVRLGFVPSFFVRHSGSTIPFDPHHRADIVGLLKPFETATCENGLSWTAEGLFQRLLGRKFRYGLHIAKTGFLISSPRMSRSVGYVCLAGYFAKTGEKVSAADARQLAVEACAYWRKPLFAYAGVNAAVERMPGFVLPAQARPSPLIVHLRDFHPEQGKFKLDRFQLLDFDFA
jgi:hypothetical protein